MNTLRLGTRKSALAQAQANWTAAQLRAAFPDVRVEIVLIMTSGDAAGSDAQKGGLKALFTKEIEEALLDRRIDLAVHSLKDMSAELPEGLVIGAVPEREDCRDAWISKTGVPFARIPKDATIATGAVRRQAQLKRLLPAAKLVAVRGNVDTRLRRLAEEEWDGIILAVAGLKRLGLGKAVTEVLPGEILLPPWAKDVSGSRSATGTPGFCRS